jgi:hypothetical protein
VRRLDQLSAGDLKIATAFGLSYDQLAAPARRVFRRLALVPGRDFDAALAAVLGGASIEDTWSASLNSASKKCGGGHRPTVQRRCAGDDQPVAAIWGRARRGA